MTRPVVAITIGRSHYVRMFSAAALADLAAVAEVAHHAGDEPASKQDLLAVLAGADACITSWGVASLDADVVAAAPRLGHLAHMGGSVKRFVSEAVWQQGIRVTSASVTLARDVAETTLGLMIVGRKRIWPLGNHVRDGGWRDSPTWDRWDARELHRSTVGLIGAGSVGRHVIDLLAPFDTTILVADPYLSDDEARRLGVEKVELDELMDRVDVVSIHAPETAQTRHMIGAELLSRLRDGAVPDQHRPGRHHRRSGPGRRAGQRTDLRLPRRDRTRAPGHPTARCGDLRTWWSPPTSPAASTTVTAWGSWPSRRSAATWRASRPSTRSGPKCSTGSPERPSG